MLCVCVCKILANTLKETDWFKLTCSAGPHHTRESITIIAFLYGYLYNDRLATTHPFTLLTTQSIRVLPWLTLRQNKTMTTTSPSTNNWEPWYLTVWTNHESLTSLKMERKKQEEKMKHIRIKHHANKPTSRIRPWQRLLIRGTPKQT